MAGNQRVGGIIQLQANGVLQNCKGEFSYNLGRPKRKAVVGTDGKLQGYTEEGQAGFIEGEITDRGDLDTDAMVRLKDATVTLELANGKVIMLRNAYYAGDGTGHTAEGNIDVRWEGNAEEVPA